MEFKGTKGKFKDGTTGWKAFKYPPDNAVGFSTHEIHYSDDGECVAEVVHGEANAILISKAPEMLEMLKSCLSFIEELKGQGIDNWSEENALRRLIYEATTIN